MRRRHSRAGALSRLAALATLTTLVLGSWLAVATSAQAHAVLLRSSPGAQTELLAAPGAIDLWFTEPLEERFSTFEVLGSDGRTIPLDGIRVDPADAHHLSGLPRAIAPGLYTVVYRTLSQDDGHEWSGSFAFTILNADGTRPAGAAFEANLGGTTSAATIAGRWFVFVGLAVPLGGALVAWLASRGREPALGRAARRTTVGLGLAALPLLAAGGLRQLMGQLEAIDATVLEVLGETRFGTFWLWRQLAALTIALALGLTLLAQHRGRDRAEHVLLALAAAAAAGGLVATAVVSHAAAAPGSGWALPIDAAHLWIAAAWVGGLLALTGLFVRLRTARASIRAAAVLEVVGPFSIFAAAAIYALAVTGVLRSLGEVSTAGALTGTGYGRWLLVKLALLAPLLGVALANRRALAGARDSAEARLEAAARLRRRLPLEAGLAVGVLAVVAVLGQVPTARDPEAASARAAMAPYNRIETADDLSVHLQVSPAAVGENELRVHAYHPDGSDLGTVDRVLLTFAIGGGGGEQVDAEAQGDGVFTARGSFLSLAQTWDVQVDVRRPGLDDTRLEFAVPVTAGTAGTAEGGRFDSIAPQLPVNTVWALVAMAGGVALLLRARPPAPNEAALRIGGAALVLIAIWLVVSAERHLDGVAFASNPVPADAASMARGEALYMDHCTACHGPDGAGDGPAAAALDPPPADMRAHVPFHPEGETYAFISEGFPGTAMPAWKDQLTEDQRWDLVNFLRGTFND